MRPPLYTPALDITLRVSTRASLVWHAIVCADMREHWWPSLEFEPAAGSDIRAELVQAGKKKPRRTRGSIDAIDDESHSLSATWTTKSGEFTTTFELLVSENKNRCKIRVVESGFPNGKYGAVIVGECRDGWREQLEDLATFLDDGENVRLVERSLRKRSKGS